MIDPSDLDGDDLVNWYRRSPADVEAEREAARQDQYDAFVSSIGGASAAPSVQPEDGRANPQAPQGTGGPTVGEAGPHEGEAGLVEARYFRPMVMEPPPVMEPPSGPLVGPQIDARGMAPVGPPRSSFFGRHDFNTAVGGYFTDLPSPLNVVTPGTPSGSWWQLSDGSRATADEVNRIYAEQQRRLKGQDDMPPAAQVHVVDKLKDGYIPQASQVAKGDRELDPTCHPYGGWERDPGFDSYSRRTQNYEAQITRAPGLDYVVRNPGEGPVKFDGCAVWDPQHPLLEAKGPGYAPLLPKAKQWGFYDGILGKAVSQANRQAAAAPSQPIEWHVAEPGAFTFFQDATGGTRPPIRVQQTSPW
jgi:hypothetical protein